MKKHRYSGWWAMLIILILLVIDQIIKVWVKTNMHLGDSIQITNWFYISFIENNGMAYGMSFLYKPLLTIFRILAICVIGYYIYKVVKKEHRFGYVFCLSLICAGAAGNIFDSLFYGQIFTISTPFNISEFVSLGQGYAPILQGKVVDMFYFPLIVTTWPEWIPVIGGNEFIFFSPVFNFADSCISIGVVSLFIFFRKDFDHVGKVFFEGTRFEKKISSTLNK